MNIGSLYFCQILMQHLRHRRTRHVSTLLGQPTFRKIPASMFTISHVNIGNNINNPAICLFRQAFILATITRFHVKNRNMQTFRTNHTKTRIRIPKHENRIRPGCHHQLVTFIDNITHCLSQIRPHSIHIHVKIGQFQIFEKNPVKIIIIILPGMSQQTIKIQPALINHGSKTNNFRSCSHDDK